MHQYQCSSDQDLSSYKRTPELPACVWSQTYIGKPFTERFWFSLQIQVRLCGTSSTALLSQLERGSSKLSSCLVNAQGSGTLSCPFFSFLFLYHAPQLLWGSLCSPVISAICAPADKCLCLLSSQGYRSSIKITLIFCSTISTEFRVTAKTPSHCKSFSATPLLIQKESFELSDTCFIFRQLSQVITVNNTAKPWEEEGKDLSHY